MGKQNRENMMSGKPAAAKIKERHKSASPSAILKPDQFNQEYLDLKYISSNMFCSFLFYSANLFPNRGVNLRRCTGIVV